MRGEKRQAMGWLLLALLVCGQVAAAAGQGAQPNFNSPFVSTGSGVSRSLLDLHIALLKRLQTLSAQHQAKASGKTPRASQAPPTLPGSLASSLERWRDAFNWGGGAPTAGGWHPVTSAPQASSLQAEARSLARYYTQPDTVALLKANPNAVPQELRGPPGMSREQACKEANKMELPDLIKKQICDPKYPWVSADAAAGLDMDTFMEPQGGIISGQLGNWYKDVANRFGSLSRGRAPRYNTTVPFKPTATRPGPRRSLQASCGTTDSFLNFLLGDGRDYFCLGIDCEFQMYPLPLYFYVGVQGCMGVLKIVSDAVAVCLQSGCKTIDLSDPKIVGLVATSLATQNKIDLHMGVCLGIEGIGKVLKKLGIGVCIGPVAAMYPLIRQMQFTFGASLWIAGLEIGGKLQYQGGADNPLCSTAYRTNRPVYDKVLKCQDWCAWKAGRGNAEFGAWLNLFFFRKTCVSGPENPSRRSGGSGGSGGSSNSSSSGGSPSCEEHLRSVMPHQILNSSFSYVSSHHAGGQL